MYNIKTSVIMKNLMNLSKLAITALITSSVFVACSDKIEENSVDVQYTANTSSIKNVGQAVDLGLPSGTKWANMNVGASSESDNGILFIWGDATGNQVQASNLTSYTDVIDYTPTSELFEMYKGEEKVGYLYDTLKVYKETYELSKYTLTKIDSIREAVFDSLKNEKDYQGKTLDCLVNVDDVKYDIIVNLIEATEVKYFENNAGANTYADVKDNAGNVVRKDYMGGNISGAPVYNIVKNAKYDPATANWGGNWRMPTAEEVEELLENCKWEFVGNGYRVSSKVEGNSNSIFLPAAGFRYGSQWYGNGNAGYYTSGQILGTYQFPSMEEQYKGSKGSINASENMPDMLIFQHGQYNSEGIYHNLSTSFGVSVRPVTK